MKTLIVAFFISILSFNAVAEPSENQEDAERIALFALFDSKTNDELSAMMETPAIPTTPPNDDEVVKYWNIFSLINSAIGPLDPNLRLNVLRDLMWNKSNAITMIDYQKDPVRKQAMIKSLIRNGTWKWERKIKSLCKINAEK